MIVDETAYSKASDAHAGQEHNPTWMMAAKLQQVVMPRFPASGGVARASTSFHILIVPTNAPR